MKKYLKRKGYLTDFTGAHWKIDCGEKLYYSATGGGKREQANFFCSSYRKNSEVCSAHYIRESVVEKAVLESMRRVFGFVQIFEKEFAQAQCRVEEIDVLIQKIYEDNASGKLSDERFATLSLTYEEEQRAIRASIPELERYLEVETSKAESLQQFIGKVKQTTQPTALTSELVHEFVEKLVVSAPRYLDGQRVQMVDIHYNGVGVIRGFSPEEMEQAFQVSTVNT